MCKYTDQDGWVDIESAPMKYEKNILVWNGEDVAMAHWYHGWCYANDADDAAILPPPTMWRMVPHPPRMNKKEIVSD